MRCVCLTLVFKCSERTGVILYISSIHVTHAPRTCARVHTDTHRSRSKISSTDLTHPLPQRSCSPFYPNASGACRWISGSLYCCWIQKPPPWPCLDPGASAQCSIYPLCLLFFHLHISSVSLSQSQVVKGDGPQP